MSYMSHRASRPLPPPPDHPLKINHFEFLLMGRPWTRVTMELYDEPSPTTHSIVEDADVIQSPEPVLVESYETPTYVLTHIPASKRATGQWRIVADGLHAA